MSSGKTIEVQMPEIDRSSNFCEGDLDYYTFDNEKRKYIFHPKMVIDKDFTIYELVMLILWDFRIYPMEAYNFVIDEPSVFQVPDIDDIYPYGGYEDWLKARIERKGPRQLCQYTINVNGKPLYLGGYDDEWDYYELNEKIDR